MKSETQWAHADVIIIDWKALSTASQPREINIRLSLSVRHNDFRGVAVNGAKGEERPKG